MKNPFSSFIKYAEMHHVVDYITGIPALSKPIPTMQLTIENYGIRLHRVFSPETIIKWENIKNILSQTQGQVTKSLSMGKAAVGLFLFGPVGALLGAGMRSKHDDREFFVSVVYTDGNDFENTLILKIKNPYELVSILTREWRNYQKANSIQKKD